MDPNMVMPAIKGFVDDLTQPKKHTKSPTLPPIHAKQNGAISQSQPAQDFANSTLGNIIQGKFKNVPGAFQNDTAAAANQLKTDPASIAMTDDAGGAGEMPSIPKRNAFQKAGANLKGEVRQIRLPAGIGAAQKEDAVSETLDRLGINGNASQQYAKLQPAMDQLTSRIKNELATNPQMVKVNDINDEFDKNLTDSVRRGDILKKNAEGEINDYKNQLRLASQSIDFKEDPALSAQENTMNQLLAQKPDLLSTIDLYKMKTIANGDASSVYKKMANNTSLTDKDKVILAYRNALDTTLAKAHPNIKQATLDMSHLYDAAPSLEKARFVNHGFSVLGTDIPSNIGGALKNSAGTAFSTVGNNAGKIGLAAGVGLGAAGTLAMPKIQSLISSQPSNEANNNQNGTNNNAQGNNIFGNSNHGRTISNYDINVNSPATIPQRADQINQNPDGTYGIGNIYSMKDQTGNPLFISPDQIKEQQLKIDQAKNTLLYKNSQAEQARVGSLQDQLNTQTQFSQQIQKPYETAQTKNNAYAQAILDAKAAGTSLANFNGTFDNFIKQISPQYADLATQLKVLESEGAINPNGMIKGSTLIPALQTAAQGNLMQFYSTLGNVVGYTGQQGGGVQTSANAPSPANVPSGGVNIPKGFNIGGGSPPPLTMPAIQ